MIPPDYEERVYAGVLGKVIAVYLGRPVEGWSHQRIMETLGELTSYVNDRADVALNNHLLVVTDDDIIGTLVFPRALRDHGNSPGSAEVGETWLDQIVEEQTVLWWGGAGNSTEHTAYLNLKSGIAAPESGSIARNGQVVAEQVGAEIFVEGFAMTRPGDPEAAADLTERAWVRTVDRWDAPFSLHGTGLLAQGTRDRHDYTVTADITPQADAAGIIARTSPPPSTAP